MKIRRPNLSEQTMEQARRMLVGITAAIVVVAVGFAVKTVSDERQAVCAASESVEEAQSDYRPAKQSIAAFRDERTRSRSVTIAQLNAIIEDAQTDDTTRREAQQALITGMERAEQENAIEGIAVALGFDSCVASVGEDTCTVIVRAESLSRQQAAQILDVACRETGMLSGSIKVIPVE